MPQRRRITSSSFLAKEAEIKVIEFQHQETMVFIQLLFGIVLAALVAVTIPYLTSAQLNMIISYDTIVVLLLVIGILVLYYTKLNKMKQRVMEIAGVRKGQAAILWIILLILILLILNYLGVIPALIKFIHP